MNMRDYRVVPVALRRAMAAEGPFGETIKLVDSAVDQD